MSEQHREIRTFVRRPGRMTPAQQQALAELAPRFCLPVDDSALVPIEVFDREAPLLLEIGFGMGDSLVALAASESHWNVLGIEVHEPGVGKCLMQAADADLAHFRVLMQDALIVLRERLPEASITRLNLYFPDPWPKKRHHKRRMLNPPFLDLAQRVIKQGGALHIATDWAHYAEHIDEVMQADSRFTLVERREHTGDAPLERPVTKFERRGLALGHRIVDWKFTRA